MNRIIDWFARNQVAANLVVVVIIAGGLMSIGQIKKEVFPEFSSDLITVAVPYPGASPEEVEEGVSVRIEEAIQSLEGIKKITSTSNEGAGTVMVELLPEADASKVLDEVKARVDAIDTFPEEAEQPIIQEVSLRKQVLNVAISGQTDERTLKRLGEQVRDEIASIPGITQTELVIARPYEISIEVSEEALRRYQLTFEDVARAVRLSSFDLPGGSVKTGGGEILFRTKGQAYRGEEFGRIVVLTRPDGTRLTVADVATVVDGFAETDQKARFDEDPAVMVQVFRVGSQSALEVSEKVRQYVQERTAGMPEGVAMTVWQDDSSYLRSRIELLSRNAFYGLVLVFLILAIFLRLRLALWVTFGIVVSFLGTFWLMPVWDVSINLISLFAFILVLGIVVDDAIVVGENIYTHQQREEGLTGAVRGAQEVVLPVVFAVFTTVAAFTPMLMVEGSTGKVMKVIPLIVIPTLLFSLVESLLVLPCHLSHRSQETNGRRLAGVWSRFQRSFARWLESFVKRRYSPFLERCLSWRYATVAVALFAMLFTAGVVGGGWVKFVFFPPVEGDNVAAILTMPLGTPADVTEKAVGRLEESAERLRQELDGYRKEGERSAFQHMLASVGEQPFLKAQQHGVGQFVPSVDAAHLGEVHIEVAPSEERTLSSTEIANRWREMTGPIPDAVELTFTASVFSPGEAIHVQLAGLNMGSLRQAADELKRQLAVYPGVIDIADSFREGKQEVKLKITPEAEALGLTLTDLARQVRHAFYGAEAQRIQRGRDEVKVMVRYPEEDRRSLGALEAMRIRLPDGAEVPFTTVAEAEIGRGFAAIDRVDRRRAISVTADVDQTKGNANDIIAQLEDEYLPELMNRYPGVSYTFEGEQREQAETLGGLIRGFAFALLMIYALLAVPFKSYLQPFLVMAAIPFGVIGAVWGHVFMGMELTILSMFGIVALAGVVVNDSLVLVDFINRNMARGMALKEAVRKAGAARFRPIVLTSLTTFAGLTPLLLERSVQAQFLIPMAVSLGFGVMFATLISLLLVPSLYMILEDFQGLLGRKGAVAERHREAMENRQTPSVGAA